MKQHLPAPNEVHGTSITPDVNNGPQSGSGLLVSKHEVAAACGVSKRTVDNWLAARKVPQLRLSPRLTRFSLPKVLAALDQFEVKEIGGR